MGSVRDRGGGGRRVLLVLNINHCTVSSEEEDTHWQEVNQSHNAMHTEGSPSPLLEHHLFSKASIWESAQIFQRQDFYLEHHFYQQEDDY